MVQCIKKNKFGIYHEFSFKVPEDSSTESFSISQDQDH